MNKRENNLKFINYLTNPLGDDKLSLIYRTNNIKFERVNLYLDFTLSLLKTIFETYMGDDITSPKQRIEHFNWCWDRTIKAFNEQCLFNDDKALKTYFKEFMVEIYYNLNGKDDNQYVEDNIFNLWYHIFNYSTNKSKADMDNFIEIYKLFDNSIKNEE